MSSSAKYEEQMKQSLLGQQHKHAQKKDRYSSSMKQKSTSTAEMQRYMISRHKKILQHAVQPLSVPLHPKRI
jgi:hypothetical protein